MQFGLDHYLITHNYRAIALLLGRSQRARWAKFMNDSSKSDFAE
jgi:hypothetical protein